MPSYDLLGYRSGPDGASGWYIPKRTHSIFKKANPSNLMCDDPCYKARTRHIGAGAPLRAQSDMLRDGKISSSCAMIIRLLFSLPLILESSLIYMIRITMEEAQPPVT